MGERDLAVRAGWSSRACLLGVPGLTGGCVLICLFLGGVSIVAADDDECCNDGVVDMRAAMWPPSVPIDPGGVPPSLGGGGVDIVPTQELSADNLSFGSSDAQPE